MELIFSKSNWNIIRLLSAASLDNTSKFVKFDGLNFRKDQLAKLLEIAPTIQNFQFSGQLTDGVAMCSSLGFLMANVVCHLEETLSRIGLMPDLYKRYVDGTLAKMPGTETAQVPRFSLLSMAYTPSMEFTI